jgi:hypothetical protein
MIPFGFEPDCTSPWPPLRETTDGEIDPWTWKEVLFEGLLGLNGKTDGNFG